MTTNRHPPGPIREAPPEDFLFIFCHDLARAFSTFAHPLGRGADRFEGAPWSNVGLRTPRPRSSPPAMFRREAPPPPTDSSSCVACTGPGLRAPSWDPSRL